MNKKLLKLLIIPLAITSMYLAVQAFLLLNNFGVFSIVEGISLDFKKTNQQDIYLLKDQKATVTFKASENNLGIILVRLVKFGQGRDKVVFRIKKEGEEKWYHESKFSGDQVKNNDYFPLGFPPIINSKNNIYIFEIESLSGTYKDRVGVSLDEPQSAFVYKYSPQQLRNYKTFFSFTFKKSLYIVNNVNYLQIAATFVLSLLFVLFMKKKKITLSGIIRFLLVIKRDPNRVLKIIVDEAKSNYLSFEKKIIKFLKKATRWFTATEFYSRVLNTNTKKRLAIGILIFLLALTYRFSASLVNLDKLFYVGLGGQGDYDQFIRAATCALKSHCPLIIHQNLLIESTILGTFYQFFGFVGGLKAYLYLMLIVSSVVATLPYILLSRKSWITLGGIIGSLFLVASDFLTQVALNFPPDNGSTFTFSMFFLVYLLTMNFGTIRWLLFFGLTGFFDGMFKALFLINDLAAFILFIPVFFYEKANKKGKSIFRKRNIKILFLSLIPLFVFLVLYVAWEYYVQIKFLAVYFLRGLLQSGGSSYVSYTSFSDSSVGESIVLQLFYLCVSAIVMLKRLIEYADLRIVFLAPIFIGLFFFSFIKPKFPTKKFILAFIFSSVLIVLLTLIKNNYFSIHKVFEGEYILGTWTKQTYIGIFLISHIIFLFILNFKYSALKLALPIIPYVIMLIILTKNSPFPRISTQVVVWTIILLAFLIDWIMMNIHEYSKKRTGIILGTFLLVLFIGVYGFPKMGLMTTQLNSGILASQNQVKYLKWVEGELPKNAVILAGGKSDLVTVGENIQRPIVYSTLWSASLFIKPNEIPGINPTDFTIIGELQNKDNFKNKVYIILEDDIYVWRSRVAGVADGVFTANPNSTIALHGEDYSIKVYKYNPTLKKAIYELNIRDKSVN